MSENIINRELILEKLNWRYATKSYDPRKKISDEDWAVLEQALILAPSSYGLQPYKYFVINDPEMREKLKPAAYNQPQITDASHLVVFAYKKTLSDADVERFINRTVEVRGGSADALASYGAMLKGAAKRAVDQGYIETWNSRQAYLALGFLLETAAMLGVDATPMEGFSPERFNEILGLTDYSAVTVAALGYRNEESDWLANLPKVRFPKEELIVRI